MKKIIKSAMAGTLGMLVLAAAVWASANSEVMVVNKTFSDLGVVTIYNAYGTAGSVTVSGPGMYNSHIDGLAVAAVINDQVVPKDGTTVNVTLGSGVIVQAVWVGNQIVVTDQQQVNGEPKPHGK